MKFRRRGKLSVTLLLVLVSLFTLTSLSYYALPYNPANLLQPANQQVLPYNPLYLLPRVEASPTIGLTPLQVTVRALSRLATLTS